MSPKLRALVTLAAFLIGVAGCGRAADPRFLTGEWRLVNVQLDVQGPAGRKHEQVELTESAGILLRFSPSTMTAQQAPGVSWALPLGPGETPYQVVESRLEIAGGLKLGIIEAGTETLELEWVDEGQGGKREAFYEFKRTTPLQPQQGGPQNGPMPPQGTQPGMGPPYPMPYPQGGQPGPQSGNPSNGSFFPR